MMMDQTKAKVQASWAAAATAAISQQQTGH
jgi:hypothetical protein